MPSYKPMTQQKVTVPDKTPDFIKELARITAKGADALTKPEVNYLHARQSYLTPEEKKTYKKVLDDLDKARAKKADKEAQVKANQKKVAPKK